MASAGTGQSMLPSFLKCFPAATGRIAGKITCSPCFPGETVVGGSPRNALFRERSLGERCLLGYGRSDSMALTISRSSAGSVVRSTRVKPWGSTKLQSGSSAWASRSWASAADIPLK